MIAEANMERCMIWDLSQLLVETVAVRSLKLTGVGKEVTFFLSLQLALQLFTVWAFKSLSLSFSLCLFTLRLRAPELLGKDTYIYTLSQTHKRHTHQLQLSSPAYSGVTTASSSFSCGNSLITDGWEHRQVGYWKISVNIMLLNYIFMYCLSFYIYGHIWSSFSSSKQWCQA